MKLRTLALAALATASFGAQAALTTYAPWDAALAGNGLGGVLFNVQSAGGVTVALGAHAYMNGAFLPNNGVSTFYAQNGMYATERANWSFDFAWDLTGNTSCATGCTVALRVDKDPTAGVDLVTLFAAPLQAMPPVLFESWNMEMPFINSGLGYDFNPFAPSSTAFELVVLDAHGVEIVDSDITVNVPEPGTVALVGLALAGLGFSRRSKIAK